MTPIYRIIIPWRKHFCLIHALFTKAMLLFTLASLCVVCSCACTREARFRKRVEAVQSEMARLDTLPPQEKAEGLWTLWKKIVRQDHCDVLIWAEDPVIDELIHTGDAGMQVLLEAIRCKIPNSYASEASHYLIYFGEPAIEPLLEMLNNNNPTVKYWALASLWHFAVQGLNPDHYARLEEAAQKLKTHPDIPLATRAEAVLRMLREVPPVDPNKPEVNEKQTDHE